MADAKERLARFRVREVALQAPLHPPVTELEALFCRLLVCKVSAEVVQGQCDVAPKRLLVLDGRLGRKPVVRAVDVGPERDAVVVALPARSGLDFPA